MYACGKILGIFKKCRCLNSPLRISPEYDILNVVFLVNLVRLTLRPVHRIDRWSVNARSPVRPFWHGICYSKKYASNIERAGVAYCHTSTSEKSHLPLFICLRHESILRQN